MKNRILAGLLCLCLLLGVHPPTAFAADSPGLSLTSGTASPGETVTLTVSVEDNPGIAAFKFFVYFDTDVFEVDPEKDIKTAGSFANVFIVGNSIEAAEKNGRYDGKAGEDGVLVAGFTTEKTKDGDALTITLKVKENAPSGDYEVALDYKQKDTVDADLNQIKLKTGTGTLTVTGGASQPTTQAPTQPPTQPSVPPVEQPTTPPAAQPASPFTDVKEHWAQDFILQAVERKLVNGYPDETYRPDNTMTRAEFVTVLWRAMGSPAMASPATFTDLDPAADWYQQPIAWAEQSGAVNGVGNGKFAPNGTVTREQVVTILHRLAGKPVGMEAMLAPIYDSSYADSAQIDSWAKDALYWAMYNGIYCGQNTLDIGQTLAPLANADRAQLAVMIIRYLDMKTGA